MFSQLEQESFWKILLDTMTEGVMIVESEGKIIYVNRAMERLCGYSKDDLIGMTCALLDFDCCARDNEGRSLGPCPLFRNGDLCDKHCSFKHQNGERVSVNKNAQVLRDRQGTILCAIEVQSDVTQLERKEIQIQELEGILQDEQNCYGIMGTSPQMMDLFDLMNKAATSDAPVLIYGESGTGKELIASVIHELGKKCEGPFIRVNCAALSESLLESELFGHVKGAFTGAIRTTIGRFEAAHSGDIFLDEIGDIPMSTQVKLLRVVEEKEIERVGDYRSIPVDVRIIAATHRDLRSLIAKGLFRDDLFYRLNVIPIFVPPLRERVGDIPLLIGHFVRKAAVRTGKRITGVDQDAMRCLTDYGWPGNVRELINTIEYAFVVCNGPIITKEDLPELGPGPFVQAYVGNPSVDESTTKEQLIDALIKSKGKRNVAANLLGVSRQTVWNRIRKYGIDVKSLCS